MVAAAAKFYSRRLGSTQHVDTPGLGWVDRTTPDELKLSTTMAAEKKHELTDAEKAKLELDNKMMDVLRNAVPPDSENVGIPEGAIVPGDVEYWAAVGNIAKVKETINAGCDVNAASEGGYTRDGGFELYVMTAMADAVRKVER